jgi:hypothetical protein
MSLKQKKHLHIIDLEVPYPTDFGGVYDLFYKLPALQAQGVAIHLHCFTKNRSSQDILKNYCVSVDYYQRKVGIKSLNRALPYIVASRTSERLVENLLKDDYPILMEGVHCTAITNDNRFNNRRKFVRLHNVEYQYYEQLYHNSTGFLKKLYFKNEKKLLARYEADLVSKATAFWTVTKADEWVYRNKLQCKTVDYLPLFLPEWHVTAKPGMGFYCLYHANLEVPENEAVALWLLESVFSKIDTPLVIAGKNPSTALEAKAHEHLHTCLVANPTEEAMQEMINKAHIHVLPSFSTTGIKIKLLNALFNGRHVVVNNQMIDGLGLENCCHLAENAHALCTLLPKLFQTPFTAVEVDNRATLLSQHFNNEAAASQMISWIWGEG